MPLNIPTSRYFQDPFRIAVLLPEVHKRKSRSLAGYNPKETQHCCRVTSLVFSDTWSDSEIITQDTS